MTGVKTLGSNVMSVAKPGIGAMAVGSPGGAGKQTIVINKPGVLAGTTLKGAQGQQIIVVTTGGGIKTMQQAGLATSQSALGKKSMIVVMRILHDSKVKQ